MTDPLDAVKLYKSLPDLIPQKVNLNGSSQQCCVISISFALRQSTN